MFLNELCILNLDGNQAHNYKLFKYEILIYFTGTERDKKSKEIQVAHDMKQLSCIIL